MKLPDGPYLWAFFHVLRRLIACLAVWLSISIGAASDPVGLQLLRSVAPGLDGSGVAVALAEAHAPGAGWQVNSSVARAGLPFFYTGTNGTATTFPNDVGTASGHANTVGSLFFGSASGMAPGVAGVGSYEADYFYQSNVVAQQAIPARIVNQSFIFGATNAEQQPPIHREYDDYADRFNVLFVNGLGNGGIVYSPAAAYNGLGVAAFGGSSSRGPTVDNQRSKPDLAAPAGATSYSAPQVAGAAALLLQAAWRGDGGDTNAADMRVLKALLLNGAVKPADWTAPENEPLDRRHGAGVLNVFNSWHQLRGGRVTHLETSTVVTGEPHPPGNATGSLTNLVGWTFAAITNTNPGRDTIQHHYVELPPGPPAYVATITLVWNRQAGEDAINDLDLHLIDTISGETLGRSITFVNNVEHVFLTEVPPGRYDVQVLKNGGNPSTGRVSATETYALAFEFFASALEITAAGQGGEVSVSWPIAPAGFVLEETAGFPAAWQVVTNLPALSSNRNVVTLVSTNAARHYRLRRP